MSSKNIGKIQNTSGLPQFGTNPKSHILVLEALAHAMIKKLFYRHESRANAFVGPHALPTLDLKNQGHIVAANLGFVGAKTRDNPPERPRAAILVHVRSTLGGVSVAAHQERGGV
nr:hypothetical protein Itr_chr06CG11670 [Ipomoea trifida]GMD10781.1 hypothetical protein Iba_chr06eCG9520 [Ipomoea batatas]